MNNLIVNEKIEDMIFEVRGKKVILSSHVAKLYKVETKALNQTIKRNIMRFPKDFCFQLTKEDIANLRSQFVTSSLNNEVVHGGTRYLPYVLTEAGIMMLSGLLKSDIAVKVNVEIIKAFVAMRKYISTNLIEQNYINDLVLKDNKRIDLLEEMFSNFKENNNEIYYEGQIYDAYFKLIDIMSKAQEELIIIDGYADKFVLDMIAKIKIKVILICRKKSLLKEIDINKYNSQYDNLLVIYNDSYHDRYIVLDRKILYHCGASLNYAGTKTFSHNKIEDSVIKDNFLEKLKCFKEIV